MRQLSPAAMNSGSGNEREDHTQEPVHGHGQRHDSNAATPPSDDGGADASSPSPLPAAPADRPQERAREHAGGGSRGTHGSRSAAEEGKKPAAIPPRSAGSSPSNTSPDGGLAIGAGTSSSAKDSGKGVKWRYPVVEGATKEESGLFDCKRVFDQLVRDQAAINEVAIKEAHRQFAEEEEQAKSSHAKKALWSKLKNLFTRMGKIVDREEWRIYSQHVHRQTIPITEVDKYYHLTEDMAIHVNLDAYSRFRRVLGDGDRFYRAFIFSYLEQVLDRQDTLEEHRLLDTVKSVSTQHTNLGWTSEFGRSYKAFKKLIKKVMGWKRQGRWYSIASANSYREEKLLEFFSTYNTTEDIFVFRRLVIAIQICSHRDEYEPNITGLDEYNSLKDWCFQLVTPARMFADHIMMTALVTALEVPLRVEQLRGGAAQDIYTCPGVVRVTLLYTGNHYDIIYPHAPSAES